MAILDMIENNDLPFLRATLTLSFSPTTVEGRYYLRAFAARAASCGQREMLEYLCLDRGVKINTIPKDEHPLWEGKYSVNDVATSTPLIGALQINREDSVLFVLDLHEWQQKQQQQQPPAGELFPAWLRPY